MHTKRPRKSGLAVIAGKLNQLWVDFAPAIAFVLAYNIFRGIESSVIDESSALFWATGVLVALTLVLLARQLLTRQPISPALLLSSGIVAVFGLIGILLHERVFIYLKPTIQQSFMGILVLLPLLHGANMWKTLFSRVFDLPDIAWRTLALRWGCFFLAMALWNEYLWRTFAPAFETPATIAGLTVAPAGTYTFVGLTFGARDAEAVWANWKLGNMALVVAFGALNAPYALKHLRTGG